MGQKVNPLSLRLGMDSKNRHNWFLDKTYANALHEDLLIEEYLTDLFQEQNSLKGHITIKRKADSVHVYAYMYSLESPYIKEITTSNRIVEIKKVLEKFTGSNVFLYLVDMKAFFQRPPKDSTYQGKNGSHALRFIEARTSIPNKFVQYKNRPYFEETFHVLDAAAGTGSVEIFSNFIAAQLQKDFRHNLFLDFLGKIIQEFVNIYPMLKGIRIQVKGRVNGSERSTKENFQAGSISLQTISVKIRYSYKPVFTVYGVCGLKVWMCFDKISK